MSWDRDAFIEVVAGVSKFEAAGIPMQTGWNTCLPCDYYKGWWFDPKSRDFGAESQNMKHDVAGSKQLLAAAGYPNGVDVTSSWPTTGYGNDLGQKVQI